MLLIDPIRKKGLSKSQEPSWWVKGTGATEKHFTPRMLLPKSAALVTPRWPHIPQLEYLIPRILCGEIEHPGFQGWILALVQKSPF